MYIFHPGKVGFSCRRTVPRFRAPFRPLERQVFSTVQTPLLALFPRSDISMHTHTHPVRCLPTPLKLTAGVLGTVSRRPSGVPWDGDHAVGGLGRDVISNSNGRGVHGVHEWHDGPSRDVRRWRTRDCPWAHRKSPFRPTGIGSSHWLGCLTDGLRHDPST